MLVNMISNAIKKSSSGIQSINQFSKSNNTKVPTSLVQLLVRTVVE